jgi:hypothetical protein
VTVFSKEGKMRFLIFVFVCCFCFDVFAQKVFTSFDESDQRRCQVQADYRARHNITGHVLETIGNFEGVGYGSSPNCETCRPKSNMVLTGDAESRGNNGMYYRVRSWR